MNSRETIPALCPAASSPGSTMLIFVLKRRALESSLSRGHWDVSPLMVWLSPALLSHHPSSGMDFILAACH